MTIGFGTSFGGTARTQIGEHPEGIDLTNVLDERAPQCLALVAATHGSPCCSTASLNQIQEQGAAIHSNQPRRNDIYV